MKNIIYSLILFFILTAGLSSVARAADITQIGGGAGSIGLGRAFTGYDEDADCFTYNPAGTASLASLEMLAMSTNLVGDLSYTSLKMLAPTQLGVFGIGYATVNAGTFYQTTLESSGRIVSGTPFSYQDSAFQLLYSRRISRDISIGGVANIINEGATSVSNAQGTGTGIDLGILYKKQDNLNIGLSFHNFLSEGMKWNTGLIEEMESSIRAGISYRPRKNLTILIDGINKKNRPLLFNCGLEYTLDAGTYLRCGLEQVSTASQKGFNYSIGVGLKINSVKFDYAFVNDALLSNNNAHYFSLELEFPSVKKDSNVNPSFSEWLGTVINDAQKDYQQGNLPGALQKISMAKEMSQNNKEAYDLIRKIDNDMNREGSLEGSWLGATKEAAQNFMTTKAISESQAKAINFIYLGEYQLAIDEYNKVLTANPNNAMALKRLGSVYYITGNKDEALRVWKLAFKIEPNNKVLASFIDKIKKEKNQGKAIIQIKKKPQVKKKTN